MTINSILTFVKAFVGWQAGKRPIAFTVLSQHEYKEGLLIRINRESITSRSNRADVATFVWVSNNKNIPYLYVLLDSLGEMGIRNLTHRIQILSSDRKLEDNTVKVNSHLSQSYYLGTNSQASAIAVKLILYCQNNKHEFVDWNWEIEALRKQTLGWNYTDYSQEKAREDSRYSLNRFEMRYPINRSLSPLLLDNINVTIEPRAEPKSRVIELLIIGSALIAITWLVVHR